MISIIPVNPVNGSKFGCKIPVDDKSLLLYFELTYNSIAKMWMVSIKNSSGKALLTSYPVIPSQNILEQYEYMGIGSAYVLPVSKVEEHWPSYTSFGTEWYLVWGDTNEQFNISS